MRFEFSDENAAERQGPVVMQGLARDANSVFGLKVS